MNDWAIDYLRAVLRERGISATELAGRAGLSSTTLTRPLNAKGDHPYSVSRRTLEKVREVTGVPFPGESNQIAPMHTDQIVIGSIDAGSRRNYANTDALASKEKAVSFSPVILKQITDSPPEMLGMLTIVGDSMSPTLIDGDQVLVDKAQANIDFDGLFAVRYGSAILVKRIGRGRTKTTVSVISDNDDYSDVESEIAEVDVIGRVLWVGRRV